MPDETRIALAPLFDVMTLQEAAAWWGRDAKGMFIRLITAERTDNKIYLRKSGKVWLTTMQACREVFGAPKNDRPVFD